MDTFTLAVNYVKDVLNGIEKTRSQDTSSTRNLYMALSKVLSTSKIAEQGELCANSNLNIFEEILCCKYTVLNKSMQTLLFTIYEVLLDSTPGYVARNIVNALLGVCNNKAAPQGGKECAAMVIGKVMEKRANDLGSTINEVIACMSRLIRNMELPVRIVAIQALINLLIGAGTRVNDAHVELARLGTKLSSDKSIDIRLKASVLLSEIAKSSSGFTSVTFDALLVPVAKALEDEAAVVQDAFSQTAAVLYFEHINAHAAGQEQAKIDLARGGSAPESTESTPRRRQSSLLRIKEMAAMSQTPQKTAEIVDFKSVVSGIFKNITKSSAILRAGYVSALRYLCEEMVGNLDDPTLEWLVTSIILMLRDPQISVMPYEEIVHFRSRLAHVIRRGIIAKLTESNQLLLAHHFINFLNTSKEREGPQRNEHELQLGLGELGIIVTALCEASSAVCDDVKSLANGLLRNSNFGVRAAAAHLLSALAVAIPTVGATFLTEALQGANVQVKQLLAFTASDFTPDSKMEDVDGGDGDGGDGGKKKVNAKEAERLQRMFYFHGYTLVISVFLKNERNITTGIPNHIVMQAFDFGLEMLTLDIHAAPLQMRHVICSIIRAGSLIVSSCLNMGYSISKMRIPRLLQCCQTLLGPCSQPVAPPSPTAGQELLYELMSVEAALVCISTLLWFCPESLIHDENCLVTIVDGLENAFRAIKTKYQSKFKTHFRFRTLHVILLECFSWLPPGSFPNTCSQLFVEALRVFRDSITTGFECTCLLDFVPPDHSILNTFGVSRSSAASFTDPPVSENMMILRIENYSVALQKKESEAFLMCFSTEASEFRRTPLHASDWMEPSPPCAFIDSRTIDASIALIAATFGHQSNDYQEKAIQLCSQAVAQYIKGASSAMGLFTSSEDKLRKDKKNYVSLKNVTAVLSAIIRSFPFHNGMSLEMDLQWVQTVADIMFDMLSYPYAEIRSASSTALGTFCSKIFGAQLMDSMGMKITNALRTSVDKKGETLGDLSGHLLAISALSLNATNLPGVQQNIATIILDTLKRSDSSLHFRAHGIFALSSMIKARSLINEESFDMASTMQFVDKVMQAIEIHLLHGSTPNDTAAIYEYELLLACLQRLVNVTTSLLLEIDPTSEHLHGVVKVWSVIRRATGNPIVQYECAEFLHIGSVVMLSCKALDPVETANFIQNSLSEPSNLKTEHLQALVQSTRILAAMNSDVVCEVSLDITLFQLLDWCVASNTGRLLSPYWGLELRAGVENVMQRHAVIQQDVESTLEFLVEVNAQISPEKRSTHWVLLCRAIALGLKAVSGGFADHDDDEEKGGEHHSEEKNGSDVSPANAMELVHFTNWCRDRAVEKAMPLTSTRSRLKCVALRCATAAAIAGGQHGISLQSDLLLGRKNTREALAALGTQTPETEQLVEVECYMSLFLHDFISLGCACAAYSIEDHRLLSLQTVSLQFLQAVVTIFWNALDPDHVHTEMTGRSKATDPSEKLLMQFMAQIISAVRSCLSARFAPQLLWTAGNLVFDFIRGGLVSDKVVVRRLGKILQTAMEEQGSLEKKSDEKKSKAQFSLPLRTALSSQVSGKHATIQDVISMTNFARMHLLTTSFGRKLGDVGEEIVQCLDSLTSVHMAAVTEKWVAIATDSARILQTQGTPWPAETPDTDCRRGGITYDPMIDPQQLKSHYELSLPYVVAAACSSTTLEQSKVPTLFSVAKLYLGHLHLRHRIRSTSGVVSDNDSTLIKNIKPSLELLILQAFLSLASKPGILETIPFAEWNNVVLSLGRFFTDIASRVNDTASYDVVCNYASLVQSIIYILVPHAEAKLTNNDSNKSRAENNSENGSSSDFEMSFVQGSWKGVIAIMKFMFGGIFGTVAASDNKDSEFPPIQSRRDDNLQVDEEILRWWVNYPKNIETCLLLLKNCNSVMKIAKNNELNRYCGNILVSLTPYLSKQVRNEQNCNILLSAIITILQEMVSTGRCGVEMSDYLSQELWLHHTCSTDPVEFSAASKGLFKTWVVVTSSLLRKNMKPCCTPTHLSAAVISKTTSVSFLLAIISTSLQFLQQQSQQQLPTGESFASHFIETRLVIVSLVPLFLYRLSSNEATATHAEVDKQSLQLIFAAYNILPEDPPRVAFLSTLLGPVCDIYSRRGDADVSSLMCGKGITHIARTHPQLFRQEIGSLEPQKAQLLQSLMRIALQSMHDQPEAKVSPASQKIAGTPGSIKKLDMKKWSKK